MLLSLQTHCILDSDHCLLSKTSCEETDKSVPNILLHMEICGSAWEPKQNQDIFGLRH